ncbi:septal ring lytic transglycosylase RlpA family lipoprotein [Longimonas halophila]|uniref:Probable endolytic peptidoglycan transglycosylase RlpA n=1 Tax=Longimonas halophila TaxID=1469170 RepID=A0A2H3NX82_9BACT|nr:septal ring lytic transglycosylase RlpA family protein [Longimonas halophila]PEN04945.1 septal ring lytic transglycosylase RlpA family lipoprotein [Longimonas halophila]
MRFLLAVLVLGLGGVLLGCTSTGSIAYESGATATGVASYYGDKFDGRTTANGETFDNNAYTAAHRTLPFGTRVRVTRTDTGAQVTVRINDRGPFVDGRIIDLSQRAARDINMIADGLAEVRIEVLGEGNTSSSPSTPADDSDATSW